jgi:hypothetical protein
MLTQFKSVVRASFVAVGVVAISASSAFSLINRIEVGCIKVNTQTNLHLSTNTTTTTNGSLTYVDNITLPNGGGTKVVNGAETYTSVATVTASGSQNTSQQSYGAYGQVNVTP